MLRFLWKCVLEVLPPTCATVVAGILLSAYHEHIIALQDVVDPRTVERVAAPATAGDKQPQAVIAAEVRSERPTDPAQIADKSPAPAAHVNSPTPAPEGDRADGTASETRAPEGSDAKTAQGAATDTQAAQLNAVLMASSPMSQPPAEIKVAQPPETKAAEGAATASEGPFAAGPPVVPPEPAAAVPATDVSSPAAKPAAAKSPESQTATPIARPRLSQHLAKPARKATVVKMESERLPPPVVAMVPLPPPAAPPTVAMESSSQVSPSRSVLPSHAVPPPPAPGAPQAIGPTSPIGPNPVVAGAAGPTSSLPAAPQGGVDASQEGVTKTSEPTRVFGVPIPPSIAAVGGALDPRPVFSAGQKAFEKIVMTAKSVVPDFGHEQ